MTIELKISGLAIFYRTGSFWQVVFICDSTHPANFRHGGSLRWTPLHKLGKDRVISIYADNPIAPRVPPQGVDFTSILNMAEPRMHGNGRLKVRRTTTKDIISMLIPAAELDSDTLTDKDYYILDQSNGSLTDIGPVAKTVKATVRLNAGAGFTMLVTDGDGTSNLVTVPFADRTTYVLEINNDCGDFCKNENDFLFYYEWLNDDTGRKFLAGKITRALSQKLENFFKTEERATALTQRSMLMPENGNCDPTVVEPPPG